MPDFSEISPMLGHHPSVSDLVLTQEENGPAQASEWYTIGLHHSEL